VRLRISVLDAATGVTNDVAVECDPDDPVGSVLDLVTSAMPMRGTPSVHGVALDPGVPVASSPLREGVHVLFGAASTADPDPFAPRPRDGFVLQVVAGPSAGSAVAVPARGVVDIGRRPDHGLVLADLDVSRRHATLRSGTDGFFVDDLGSANGVFVEGVRVSGSHALREGETLQLGASRLVLEQAGRAAAVLTRAPDGAYLINRRFPDRREPFSAPKVTLPAPLAEDDARGLPLLAMLLPLVAAVVLALVMRSPMYLVFGLLSPLLMLGSWWSDRRRRKVRERRQQGSYGDKLTAALTTIQTAVDDEDLDLRRNMPDPTTIARTALDLRRELWSRRPGDDDWLLLRLGTADRPASVEVTGERPPGWEDPVLRRAPVGVALDELGVLGLAGPGAWTRDRIGWVLAQVAVLHSPDELRVAVLAPTAGEEEIGWLRWLPHVRAGEGLAVAWNDDTVEGLLRALGEDLDRRLTQVAEHRGAPVGQLLVVLLGAGALARKPQVVDLLARGPALGLRFVCVDADDRLLPDSCRAVFVDAGEESVLRVDRGEQRTLAPDALPPHLPERIARTLAPLRRVGDVLAGGLPDSTRFTELIPPVGAGELQAQWRLRPGCTDVVIGRDGDGTFAVDIARHGPHAVVAGTSGAGKSELLQTWVAALARANTPEQLSIIFMDYKGGATFRDLAALPHVVGMVTNLDARLAERAQASLRAELTRRQQQLAAAGATDRADYLRRAAEANPGELQPFPRLLIIVDELAELKEQLPTLVEGLVGVARIGRSLGVHLVLATQKPGGVVDAQIRANVDLRICLRTRDDGESMEVIESPAAARIPKERPGRALVSRGGATPVMVQTARVTTPLMTTTETLRRAVSLPWHAVAAPPARRRDVEGLRTDLQELVDTIVEAAAAEGLAAPFRPWAPPLPEELPLHELPATRDALLLGLRDRPDTQRQEPLEIPLGSGHVAVVGSGRTGRTTTLRSIAAGLARAHAPTDVHVHVVDGSGGLAGLVALPSVGVVAGEDDPERLERLITRLAEEVRTRRRALTEQGASSVAELDADAPPWIVLLVDDWYGVVEGDGPAQVALRELLSGAATAAGVTVVLAGDERLLRGRVLNRLDHRLCLRLNNPPDATALGLGVRQLPEGLPPGRGLWAADGTEVQVPLLVPEPHGAAQTAALTELGAQLRAAHGEPDGDRAPLRLDPLPFRIGLDAARALPAWGKGDVVLGVAGDRLAAIRTGLGDAVGHVLVAGPGRSGRSTAVAGIAASAASSGSRTVLVAPRRGAPHRAAEQAGVQVVASAELGGVLDTGAVDVVAVDDADIAALDDALVSRLAGPGGPVLVVAAQIDAFGFARGLIAAAKKAAGPVVLLCPPNHLAAENVGVRIERGSGFSGPPGRAVMAVAGELLLGQVVDLTA
jgi:DNA segregation ATPase FtsK/SpoIIIE, S-DNA-T family